MGASAMAPPITTATNPDVTYACVFMIVSCLLAGPLWTLPIVALEHSGVVRADIHCEHLLAARVGL
jgi:hypothetical protein